MESVPPMFLGSWPAWPLNECVLPLYRNPDFQMRPHQNWTQQWPQDFFLYEDDFFLTFSCNLGYG